MVTTKEKRQEIIGEFRRHEKDSGSPEVQVAILTDRIQYLTEHMKRHAHDYHSRRGLVLMVERRKRLLTYLRREDQARYAELIKRLGLRK